MKAARFFLVFISILFILYGLSFLAAPEKMCQLLVGGVPSTATAIADMRATYGGICIGIGLLLVASLRNPQTTTLGLWGISIILSAMLLGRFIGLALDGDGGSGLYTFFIVQVLLTVAAFTALTKVELGR